MTRFDGVRRPAVAGSFYPADAAALGRMVGALLAAGSALAGPGAGGGGPSPVPLGLLVPHAGLVYSGVLAAAAWRTLGGDPETPGTVVILGTNHVAPGLRAVAAWPAGAWATPSGALEIDEDVAAAIIALGPPFRADPDAHLGEHSIEVQLPLLMAVAPGTRVVPLSVGVGTGAAAIEAGHRLGGLLADRRAAGERVVLAVSSDMAHYPPAAICEQVTRDHLPSILRLDAEGLGVREDTLLTARLRGVSCGMCGIEPAVLGLAALRALGAATGTVLGAATSADAGGPADRTVGYLAVRFDPLGPAPDA